MVQHHNKKLVFGLGLLAVAVFCLLVCPTVTAGAVVTELIQTTYKKMVTLET